MPLITPEQKAKLRSHSKSDIYLSIMRPQIKWSMRVNDPGIEQGETLLSLDSGTDGGDPDFHTWLTDATGVPGMEMWIGTSPGASNVGIVRLRAFSSDDDGVTASVLVSRNSIWWADDMYVSFIYNWPLKPMFPLIFPDGTFTKEGDIEYSDQNTSNGPVVIAGTWTAVFYAPPPFGTLIAVDMSESYTTTPGATIVEYDAQVIGCGGGCGGIFDSAIPTGLIGLSAPGPHWVRFKVTDSDGNVQLSYRLYMAHSPDRDDSDFPITDFEVTSLDGDWDAGGWRCQLRFRQRDDFPVMTNAPVILWREANYGGERGSVTCLPNGFYDPHPTTFVPNPVLFCGYLRNINTVQDRDSGVGIVECEATTIDGLMRNRYQYSVSLETVQDTPDKWYEFPSYLDPGLGVYHFLRWHTRVLECCDVIGLRDNTDGIAYTEFEDGNFYSMPDDYSRNRSIRYRIVCDKGGRLHFVPEPQLLTDTERDALVVADHLEKADMGGSIEFVTRPENTTAQVFLYGFSFEGTFLPDGKPDATPRCSVAPGLVPHDDGPTVTQINYQTVRSQEHADQLAGRFLAMMNNRYPEVSLTMNGDWLAIMDVAFAEWWTMDVAADDTPLGFEWDAMRMKLRKVSAAMSHESGVIEVSVVFEPESPGPSGIPIDCPAIPDVDEGETPDIPPPETLGGAIMTGASANYLSMLARDWDLRTPDPVSDLEADPWWRMKQGSTASGDAIVWRCGLGNIYRSDDAGLTWDDRTPASLSACAGETVDVGDVHFIRHDPSFIEDGRHCFLAIYNNAGAYISWMVVTDDDGATWSDVCLNGEIEIVPGPGTVYSSIYFAKGSVSVPFAKDTCVYLTDTKFITFWRGAAADADKMYALVCDVDANNDITAGSFYLFSDDLSIGIGEACRLADDRAMLLYYSITDSVWRSVMVDVTGTVVSYTGINTLLSGGDIPSLVTLGSLSIAIALMSTSSVMWGLATLGNDGVDGMFFTMLTISGDTVTPSVWAAHESTEVIDNLRMAPVSISEVAVVYTRTNGGSIFSPSFNRTAHSVVATVGAPITFGAVATIYSNDTNLVSYAPDVTVVDGKAVCTYNADITPGVLASYRLHLVVGTVGTSISWGSPVIVESQAVACPSVQSLGTGLVAVAYPMTTTTYVKTYIVSGTSLTLDDTYTVSETGDNISIDRLETTGRLVVQGYSHIVVFGIEDAGGGGVSDLRAIDLRIGRGDGSVVYVTAVDATNDETRLLTCSMSEVLSSLSLGPASEYDVGVEVYFGSDSDIVIYGRLTVAEIVAHAMYSSNGGASFEVLISTWGSDRCSALRVSSGGDIRAIRSSSDEARLYTLRVGSPVTYRSTLPFPAGVNLRALAVSAKGVAYAAADTPNDLMVVMSRPPFASWKDITYDHPTDEGVNSVVIL